MGSIHAPPWTGMEIRLTAAAYFRVSPFFSEAIQAVELPPVLRFRSGGVDCEKKEEERKGQLLVNARVH